MKKLVYLFLLLGTGAIAQKTEKREVSDFNAIKVSQSINVDFTYGNNKLIEVEVQEPLDMQYVKTEVVNGILQIYIDVPKTKKLTRKSINEVKVTIINPKLEGVKISSSAKFTLKNQIVSRSFYVETSSSAKYLGALVKTDNLLLNASSSSAIVGKFEVANKTEFSVSSSARIKTDLATNKLEGKASSSSFVVLSGSAKEANITASSSSTIESTDFIVNNLNITASSSSLVKLNVTQSISGKVSSSGKVLYKNKPASVNVSTSSSGVVGKM